MASVLLLEPHPEIRDLLVRITRRLGHEPVVLGEEPDAQPIVDVVVVEPADIRRLELARAVRERCGAPVICVSIYPPSVAAGGLEPVAHLLKPFSLAQFERALTAAATRSEPLTAA